MPREPVTNSYADGLNDVGWYLNFPPLVEATARLPFPNRPGMWVPSAQSSLSEGDTTWSISVPGVLALEWYPGVGYSDDVTSPASIAARELYGTVRSAFSSELPEDAPDLLMYIIALDEVHAYIAHIKRIYGLLNQFNGNNFEYPDRVLKALGITETGIQNLRANKTQMWGRLNTVVYNANKFCVPGRMHIFARHRYMNEHVFLDANSPMAQTFVFVQKGYHVVNDQTETGTSLHFESIPAINSLDDLFSPVDAMITALSEWGDAYTIDGHLRRAFADSVMLGSELLDANYVLSPTYDPEALVQIENAHFVITATDSLDITQDPATNKVIFQPSRPDTPLSFWHKPMLNIHSDAPTALDVVVATRLHTCVSSAVAGSRVMCGTEILNRIKLYSGNHPDGTLLKQDYEIEVDFDSAPMLVSSCIMSWFDHAPIGYVYNPATHVPYLRGNLHNVTSVEAGTLEDLNRVCIYSEFNCFGAK